MNENDKKFLEYCELLIQAKEAGLGFIVEWQDTLYLVPTPIVKINALNQFHSVNSPAIKWKGGQEIFALNGVIFPKKLFDELTQYKLSFQDILAIEDVDQRNQAMRFVGKGERERFLAHVKAEKIDEYEKRSLEGKKISYKLYRIPKSDIFRDNVCAIWYECPSTGLDNFSGVPNTMKTVADSMAWKQGITADEWRLQIPLLHES